MPKAQQNIMTAKLIHTAATTAKKIPTTVQLKNTHLRRGASARQKGRESEKERDLKCKRRLMPRTKIHTLALPLPLNELKVEKRKREEVKQRG